MQLIMTMKYIFILAFLLLVSISDASPSRRARKVPSSTTMKPTWMGDYCTKDSDCNSGECCVYKPDRYSVPECRGFGKENDICIPSSSTLNITLFYPDGSQLKLFDVHRILCPCVANLKCNKDGVCDSNNVIEKSFHVDN